MERETIVDTHHGLIHMVCKKYRYRAKSLGFEYEDVVQMASEGLIKACDTFVPSKSKFSTYGVKKMRGEILRRFRDWNIGAKLPREVKAIVMNVQRSDLPIEVVAEELNAKDFHVELAKDFLHHGFPVYTSERAFGDDQDACVGDQLGSEQDYTSIFVQDFIETLDHQEKTVCNGVLNGRTQREMCADLGVSQTHISRILGRVRKKLGEYYETVL